MARGGKSHLGNSLQSNQDIDDADAFSTSAGVHSCTQQIQSHEFPDCQVEGKETRYDITFVDTPGLPDTEGATKSIEVYDGIVDHINSNTPTAIVLLVNNRMDIKDEELYKKYAILMREFANKGIYFAILVNNQGSTRMNRSNIEEAETSMRSMIHSYDLGPLCTDDGPYLSVNENKLKGKLMDIIDTAVQTSHENPRRLRNFRELEAECESEYVELCKRERLLKEKDDEIKAKEFLSNVMKVGHRFIQVATYAVNNIADESIPVSTAVAIVSMFEWGSNQLRTYISTVQEELRPLQLEKDQMDVDIEGLRENFKKLVEGHYGVYELLEDNEKMQSFKNEYASFLSL